MFSPNLELDLAVFLHSCGSQFSPFRGLNSLCSVVFVYGDGNRIYANWMRDAVCLRQLFYFFVIYIMKVCNLGFIFGYGRYLLNYIIRVIRIFLIE